MSTEQKVKRAESLLRGPITPAEMIQIKWWILNGEIHKAREDYFISIDDYDTIHVSRRTGLV